MTNRTCLLLEVSGIQSYIFGSNQLAQNIGASEIVALSTTKWVVEQLDKLGSIIHNGEWADKNDALGPVVHYKEGTAFDVEIVYAGGGNTLLLFNDEETALTFTKQYTKIVLEKAPNLNLAAVHHTFDWQTASFVEELNKLRQQMGKRKQSRRISTPLLGLSVTAECVYTGLPAIGYDDNPQIVGIPAAKKVKQFANYQPRLISSEVAAKLRFEDEARERLHEVLPQVRRDISFGFAYDFDELGEFGESSYIAVVHADGNKMGERFKKLADAYAQPEQNEGYVQALRNLSTGVRKNATEALQETVDYLIASLVPFNSEGKFGGVVNIPRTRNGDELLPFRPIVFGGDDVTFVCDGRLGLDLAAKYLEAFSGKPLNDEPVFARAGVAVIKTHYPFSRAYQLAEDLAASAKKKIKDYQEPENESATVMDWHFATTGMMFDLAEIRDREYQSMNQHSLLMRPVVLADSDEQWRTWKTFNKVMEEFQQDEWMDRRNKVLALRQALRQEKSAVELFLHNYQVTLPGIKGKAGMKGSGWQNNECGYYDAIEAIDFFVSLKRIP